MSFFDELDKFSKDDDKFNFLRINNKKIDFNTQNNNGDNLFHYFYKTRCKSIIKFLIKKGVNPNVLNNSGELPIMKIIMSNDMNIIKVFLKNKKLDINSSGRNENTPLHEVVTYMDKPKILGLLVKNKILIDIMNEHNETALHIAINEGNYESIAFLIKKGANVELRNSEGMTAYELAKDKEDKKAMKIIWRK